MKNDITLPSRGEGQGRSQLYNESLKGKKTGPQKALRRHFAWEGQKQQLRKCTVASGRKGEGRERKRETAGFKEKIGGMNHERQIKKPKNT